MNLYDALSNQSNLYLFFKREYPAIESLIITSAPSLSKPFSEDFPLSLLEKEAFNFYLHWNISVFTQNKPYMESFLQFLDILKDFEVVTVEDGFDADSLQKLEEVFYLSFITRKVPTTDLFLTLAAYYSYHQNLNDILMETFEADSIFPSAKEFSNFRNRFNHYFPIANEPLFNHLGEDAFNKIPLPDFNRLFENIGIELFSDKTIFEFSYSIDSVKDEKEWFSLIAKAYMLKDSSCHDIERVSFYHLPTNHSFFIELNSASMADKQDEFIKILNNI